MLSQLIHSVFFHPLLLVAPSWAALLKCHFPEDSYLGVWAESTDSSGLFHSGGRAAAIAFTNDSALTVTCVRCVSLSPHNRTLLSRDRHQDLDSQV